MRAPVAGGPPAPEAATAKREDDAAAEALGWVAELRLELEAERQETEKVGVRQGGWQIVPSFGLLGVAHASGCCAQGPLLAAWRSALSMWVEAAV